MKKILKSLNKDNITNKVESFKNNDTYIYFKNNIYFYFLYSLIINVIIFYLSKPQSVSFIKYITESPTTIIKYLASTIVFLTVGYICLYFKNRNILFTIYSIIWVGLSLANNLLIKFRGGALTKHDFNLVKEGVALTKDFFTTEDFIKIGIFIVFAISLICFAIYSKKREFKYNFKKMSNVFVILIVVSLGGTFVLKETKVITLKMNSLSDSSAKNTFVYYFIDNLISSSMKRPFNYNKQAMLDIEKDIQKPNKEMINKKEPNQKPNIVAIQLESLFDPTTLKDFTFSEDPMPYMRKLMKNYTSGKLNVPTIGGGTARSEFEFLTSMSLDYMSPGEIPHNSIIRSKNVNSIAHTLKDYNYKSHVVHNFTGTYYDRSYVFKNLGFDTFSSSEIIPNATSDKGGISGNDMVFASEIKDILTEEKNSTFIFGITVQLHGNYPTEPTPLKNNISILSAKNTEMTDSDKNQINYYINELREVEKAIEAIVKTVEEIDEHTIVVFYSDHVPPLNYIQENIDNKYLYNVPYVIWDNYGLKKQDEDISCYELASKVLNMAGIEGNSLNRIYTKIKDRADYQKVYQLTQYDMLKGKDYLKERERLAKPNMKVGRKDSKITKVERNGDFYQVYGENFHPNMKGVIDGKEVGNVYYTDENFVQVHIPDNKVHDEFYIINKIGKNYTTARKTNIINVSHLK